jgi:hypothetical protein
MWRKNLEVMHHPSANQVKRFDELDQKTQEVFTRTAEEFIDEHCPSGDAPAEVPRG